MRAASAACARRLSLDSPRRSRLRLWGIRHGLPYVFNADEGAHFVPRAIGMFGHSLNPQYFVNPPAFTYLLHFAFWARWGSREAVGGAFAADPSTAFAIARVLAALLGVAAVGLLAWAGARLFDRRVGLSPLHCSRSRSSPVHYSHLAVNDMPALAPLCLSLVGAAGVYRDGRLRDYALAGAALGVACATKYTAGIVLLCLLGAAAILASWLGFRWDSRRGSDSRAPRAVLAGALAVAGFVVANPYALFDLERSATGSAAVAGVERRRRQARADRRQRRPLLPRHADLGLRRPARAGGRRGRGVAQRPRPPARARAGARADPAPDLFLGLQDRFFARWLLPVYPLLCLLAAWAAIEALRRAPVPAADRRRAAVRARARLLDPQRRRARARRHAGGGARLDGRPTSPRTPRW